MLNKIRASWRKYCTRFSLDQYIHESRKARKMFNKIACNELVRYYRAWASSLNEKRNALDDMSPWITFAAIAFLDRILSRDMNIFEYGSGGSTLFFATRAKKIVSIEHDKVWGSNVSKRLRAHGIVNSELLLVEPVQIKSVIGRDPSDFDSYISSDKTLEGLSFEEYVKKIDRFPDGFFDFISIDGRARPSCLKHALPKAKKNGFIMLDNAERKAYEIIHHTLDELGWVKTDFFGPGPYCKYFWRTTFWQKINSRNW